MDSLRPVNTLRVCSLHEHFLNGQIGLILGFPLLIPSPHPSPDFTSCLLFPYTSPFHLSICQLVLLPSSNLQAIHSSCYAVRLCLDLSLPKFWIFAMRLCCACLLYSTFNRHLFCEVSLLLLCTFAIVSLSKTVIFYTFLSLSCAFRSSCSTLSHGLITFWGALNHSKDK